MASEPDLSPNPVVAAIQRQEADLLEAWMTDQLQSSTLRRDLLNESTLRRESMQFLQLLVQALQGPDLDIRGPGWTEVRGFLDALSASRAHAGFTYSETATFVFSLKQPLYTTVQQDSVTLEQLWTISRLLDDLGLYTVQVYQHSREDIILRQRDEMLELSTPAVTLWNGIVALPLIGTLDTGRTQAVMESLLNKIVETGASIVVLDITGVPTVDTAVAQHLMKTVAAARLMGAECIISGVRPAIAQTIVQLGLNLDGIVTKASLADALKLAFSRSGLRVVSV
ncbi:STAS domain-containing protein [Deinococcus sonorensis]|uniref:STAS domain-containing protein n=2 Tax=Deinococcus sonorensis TaxID=309891 RepID=A0AAU7U5E3_9DEIO